MTTKPLLVVVDDTDARVKYSKGWFQDNGSQDRFGSFGPTYRHTQHGINQNGSFTFFFEGSYVKVYGTPGYAKTDNTNYDPVLSCTVDGTDLYTIPPSTSLTGNNNQVLCSNETLPDGPHTLTVNVTSHGKTFWFDYIRYQPPATTNITTLKNETVFIDDRYPSISYSDGWSLLNDSLAHYTQKKGATMKFGFNGTGITWYAQIPPGYAQDSTSGSYTIDSKNPTTFSIVGPPNNNTKQYYQALFSATGLRAGSHSLAVTYQGDRNHAPLTLDYLVIEPGTGSSSPSKGSSKTPIGAIIGGVLGGIAFLVILGLILFFILRTRHPGLWRRRRRSRLSIVPLDPSPASSPTTTSYPHHSDGHVEAFVHPDHDMREVQRDEEGRYLMAPVSSGPSSDSNTGSRGSHSYLQVSNGNGMSESNTSRPSKAQMAKPEKMGRVGRVVHHEDSGLRLPGHEDGEGGVIEVPPSYSAR